MYAQRFQQQADRYLKELRAGAMIEYKEQPKEESHAPRASRNHR